VELPSSRDFYSPGKGLHPPLEKSQSCETKQWVFFLMNSKFSHRWKKMNILAHSISMKKGSSLRLHNYLTIMQSNPVLNHPPHTHTHTATPKGNLDSYWNRRREITRYFNLWAPAIWPADGVDVASTRGYHVHVHCIILIYRSLYMEKMRDKDVEYI